MANPNLNLQLNLVAFLCDLLSARFYLSFTMLNDNWFFFEMKKKRIIWHLLQTHDDCRFVHSSHATYFLCWCLLISKEKAECFKCKAFEALTHIHVYRSFHVVDKHKIVQNKCWDKETIGFVKLVRRFSHALVQTHCRMDTHAR